MRQRASRLLLIISSMLIALITLTAVSAAAAQGIVVEKRVEQQDVVAGSLLAVEITVRNLGDSAVDAVVREVVVGAEPFSPGELVVPAAPVGFIGMRLPYYEWKLSIAPGASEVILYIIRPLTPGEHVIAPTRVLAYGQQYLSAPVTVDIACNADGVCESAFSENYLNCPADCAPGSGDNVCNPAADGMCDADCADSVDSDCIDLLDPEPLDTAVIGFAVGTEPVPRTAVPFAWPHLVLFLVVLVPVSGVFLINRSFRNN